MTLHLGKVKPGSTIYLPFDTFAGATGASITMSGLATSDILIFKNGSVTQRASTTGYTLLDTDGIDFDGVTGIHGISIDLSSNATADFYTAGGMYWVVIQTITIDGQSVSFVLATFTIGYESAVLDTTIATLSSQTSFTLTTGPAEDDAINGCEVVIHDIASAVQVGRAFVSDYTGSTRTVTLVAGTTFTAAAGDNISVFLSALQPTVQGRALDVSAGGEAGLDWANIGSPTTAVNLSGTNIDVDQVVASVSGAVGSVTGSVGGNVTGSVGSVATGGITAASIATGAIDADALAADAVAEIADGVWDEDATGHQTQGTFGQAIGDPVADADTIWGLVNTNLNATVSSRASQTSLDTLDDFVDTEIGAIITTLGTPAGASISADIAAIEAQTDDIGVAGAGLTAIPWNAAWDAEVQSEVTDALVAANLTALVIVSGTADSGSTTTMVDAARTEADNDYWKGRIILFTSGNISGQAVVVTDFVAATDTFTFAPALTQAVSTQTYVILPGISVWDDVLADHLTAGSTGSALNAAGSAGDPWGTALPGAYGAGSAGFIVGTNLDATVSSRLATAGYTAPDNATIATIQSDTNDLQTRVPAALVGGRMDSSVGAMAADVLTSTALAASAVTEIQTGLSTLTAAQVNTEVDTALSDVGLTTTITGRIDVATSTRLASASYTAPDNATVSTINTKIGTPAGVSVSADIAAIEAQTDDIGTAGAGLTALPWNAAWDAEVQSEVADALTAYGASTYAGGAVASVTGNVGGSVAGSVGSVTAAVTVGTNNDKTGYALTAGERTSIATTLLTLDLATITGEAARSVLNALRALRNRVAVAAGVMTVYEEDDTTTAWTAAVTTDATADPVTQIDPS